MSIEALVLRFDAPLMSFGGPLVDARGVTDRFPGRSLLTGLFANALGWDHREGERMAQLQSRIVLASRIDREGSPFVDFHTVDLGQPFMARGWTTRGAAEGREGGTASEGTHIRHRHYIADAVYTLAVALTGTSEPTLAEIGRALEQPARPLFLGRKACLPSRPLLIAQRTGDSLRAILEAEPRATPRDPREATGPLAARFPEHDASDDVSRRVAVADDRDWLNQVHTGRRFVREGTVTPPGAQTRGIR